MSPSPWRKPQPATATAPAFPHPTKRTTFRMAVPAAKAAARPAPTARVSSAGPARVTVPRRARSSSQRRDATVRKAVRFMLFYLTTAALIAAGVAVHEYAHYAAHEGMGVPEFQYSNSVNAAQHSILQVERSRSGGHEVVLQEPKATTIVIFPNTFVQAAGLGMLPTQAYQDDGILASTYFRLDKSEVDGLQARDGEMSAAVVAAPLIVAGVIFLGALAWVLVKPNLFNKALLVSYAVQIGNAGHHAGALGIPAPVFFILSTLAIVVAAVLVALRITHKPRGAVKSGPAAPANRSSAKGLMGTAPRPLSVRRPTDNHRTHGGPKPVPA